MAINQKAYRVKRTAFRRRSATSSGFALLVAVIFMSVMLSFGLVLGSLAYKQESLASTAIESQYAFYAADAALECGLYADQQQNLFAPSNHDTPGSVSCDQSSAVIGSGPGVNCYNQPACPNEWVSSTRLSLDGGAHCADLTVYKPVSGTTYLFAQGYSVSCSTVANGARNARFSARGMEAHY